MPILLHTCNADISKPLFMKKQILIAGSLLLSSMTYGAGYQLNLQGLRQLAMGGSGTAIPWDMSTIFYNPGGLGRIDYVQAYASAVALMPNVQYAESVGSYTASSVNQTFVPFNVYVGGPVAWRSPVKIGLGITTPYGSGLKWDDNWRGRYMIQEINLRSVFIQPTVSYEINDELSVGAGFVYAVGSVDLRRAIPLASASSPDGSASLEGNGHGFGVNVGVHFTPSEKVELGLNFRSQVNMKVKRGYATFNVPTSLSGSFPYTAFSTELPLPAVTSIGIGYHVNEDLTLQADINYVGWNAYRSLNFDYEQNTTSLQDTRSARRYHNTLSVRIGGHYQLSDKIAFMLGGAWDPTPVRDGYVSPELPDANRGVLTGGVSYRPIERLTFIAAVEAVGSVQRDADYDEQGFSGKYQTTGFAPGLGVTFDF